MNSLQDEGPKTVFNEINEMLNEGILEPVQVENYSIVRIKIKEQVEE